MGWTAERSVPKHLAHVWGATPIQGPRFVSPSFEVAMDFLRRSFFPWEAAGVSPADHRFGAHDAPPLLPAHFPLERRIAMSTRGATQAEVSGNAPLEDDPLHAAQLHAELREVPLPAGFMHRVRQLVQQGLDGAE